MNKDKMEPKEAKKKMTKLVNDIKFTMMVTNIKQKPLSVIPMTTKKVDEDGNIWFLSSMESEHNANITKDADVQLLYSNNKDMEFISIYGKASITREKMILKELYSKVDDAWFDGVEDSSLTAIKVIPSESYYWDTKDNKYVSLFKMGLSAVTGDKKDIGEKGKLNL